ncbi:contractile injection system protein, VgrG/Pvc8 family [Larsenimonas suaedae]|uniref:Contractile injection system protein, VgrG/Pvc8 family n=1 Tax=Larsenimonas suaedae TaxID=1851019 RepID=A0ABU1GYL4_9GAMM|nr:contractile injection system protein, VgrG/Pvc8 family [Larsenimonas suaedae]MCM2973489.1 contractile injection system protein, VgrG/Pvc8 family [Larsenimonas suaedae]MDR5897142.1 contractile injection system protein, VgrG/Pvc8 family [Larsenimonas suaedae]
MSEQPTYRRPGYRITLASEDITPRINGRLIDLRITSQRGQEADQLDLTLADHDGKLALPPTGARLSVAIGWQHEGLIERGVFIVDELEHSGSPDHLTLRARAADMRHLLPGKRSQSWHDITLGDIVDTIAKRHQLTPVIGKTLHGIRVGHIDQTDESDLNFLTRLGERYDAIAAVKSERMLFTLAGEALTASGTALPRITLTRRDGDHHRFSQTDRDSFTGVRAYWNDTAGSVRKTAIAGEREKFKDLRATYASEADALEAAKAELRRIQRGKATFELTLAQGRADLMPETPVTLNGWKPGIDGKDWLVTEVEDSLDERGYGTRIKCEVMRV